MKKFIKKTVAGLIAGVMAISSMPLTALASDNGMNFKTNISIAGYEDQYGMMYYTKSNNDYAFSVLKEVNKDGVITVKKGSDFTITQSFGTWSNDSTSTAGDESFASKGLHWHYGSNSTDYALGATTTTTGNGVTNWTANVKDSSTNIQSAVDGTLANQGVNDNNRANSSDGGSHEAYGTYHFTPSSFSQLNTPGVYEIELKTTVSFSLWKYVFPRSQWCSIYGTTSTIPVTVRVVDDYKFVKNDGSSSTVTATSYSEALNSAPANTAQATVANNNGTHTIKTYSWPSTSTSNTINEEENSTNQNCYGGEATCQQKAKCEVCGAEYGEVAGHTYVYTNTGDADTHKVTCEKGDFDENEAHDFDENGVCTKCGYTKVVIDYSSLNSAIAAAKATYDENNADGKYTDDSFATFKAAYDAAVAKVNNAESQTEVEEVTTALVTAQNELEKAKFDVTFYTVAANASDKEVKSTALVAYGDTFEANAESNVAKWIVETDNGNTTTVLNSFDKSVSVVITKDATIYAYLSDEEQTSTSSKVTFLGKNGQVVAVRYIAEGYTLNTSDVELPSVPFYTTTGWDTETVTGDGKDYTVNAVFTCNQAEDDMCTVHFGEWSKKYSYDSYVYLPNANTSKKYALYSDEACTQLLTYIDGVDFYAPKTKDIYVAEVTEQVASIGITGVFNPEADSNYRYLIYNCKFYLPEGSNAIDWGVEYTINGKTSSARIEVKSERNEYSARFKTAVGSDQKTVEKARAYVTYTDNNGKKNTIYSDYVVNQTL